MEDVLDELIKNYVELPKLMCSTTGNCVLRLHEEDDMVTTICKTITIFTHVDYGALSLTLDII